MEGMAGKSHYPVKQGDTKSDAGDLRETEGDVEGGVQADQDHQQQAKDGPVQRRGGDEPAVSYFSHPPQQGDKQ